MSDWGHAELFNSISCHSLPLVAQHLACCAPAPLDFWPFLTLEFISASNSPLCLSCSPSTWSQGSHVCIIQDSSPQVPPSQSCLLLLCFIYTINRIYFLNQLYFLHSTRHHLMLYIYQSVHRSLSLPLLDWEFYDGMLHESMFLYPQSMGHRRCSIFGE